VNPNRTSRNVDGDFYSTGYWAPDGEWGDCLDCALPEDSAPELLADIENEDNYTHFIRQPENDDEVEKACDACEVCCVNALRYGGKDKNIITRLYNTPDYCDYLILESGAVEYALDSKGEYLPFSLSYKVKADKVLQQKYGKSQNILQRTLSCLKS
jgi:hypothetical protein